MRESETEIHLPRDHIILGMMLELKRLLRDWLIDKLIDGYTD